MQAVAIRPNIYTTDERIIISIPKFLFWKRLKKVDKEEAVNKKEKIDFSSLIGCMADIPEFKGKSSVEVQHMITDLWAKNYS